MNRSAFPLVCGGVGSWLREWAEIQGASGFSPVSRAVEGRCLRDPPQVIPCSENQADGTGQEIQRSSLLLISQHFDVGQAWWPSSIATVPLVAAPRGGALTTVRR